MELKGLNKDKIKLKEYNKDIYDNLTLFHNRDLIKKIYANRYDSIDKIKELFEIKLPDIISKDYIGKLVDIDKAAKFINDTINNNGKILLCTDYDVDGVTSAVIGHYLFKDLLEYDNVEIIVNKREFSNGINNTIKEIVLDIHKNDPISLFMTADHGSSDLTNIEEIYKVTNAKIVVTDHHLYKEDYVVTNSKIMKDDLAFINPQRPESTISKNITGATVLYFTLIYTYLTRYDDLKDIPDYKWKIIYYLLTYIGTTIISDCMDLRDPINRKFVIKALRILNSKNIDHNPFWKVIKQRIDSSYFIDETTLGFEVIPMLNTPGRIDDPYLSFKLMTSDTENDAKLLLDKILKLNEKRKGRQNKVLSSEDHIEYFTKDILVMYAKDSKDIQGIIANRMLFNRNFKIVFVFSKHVSRDDIYIGSARVNDENIDITKVLKYIKENTDYIIEYGGHAAAAGIKISTDIKGFYEALVEHVYEKYTFEDEMYTEVDEIIYSNKKLIISINDIRDAGPYGINYPKPLFVSDVVLEAYRIIDKGANVYITGKVRLSELSDFKITFFYTVKKSDMDIVDKLKYVKKLRLVYNVSIDKFFNYNKIFLNVEKLILKEDTE